MSEENKSQFKTMQFVITGESLTNTYRERCLDSNWRKALSQLKEEFEMDTDTAVSILSGKKRLIGDSTNGIYLEDEEKTLTEELSLEYQECYLDQVFEKNNQLYEFYAVITDYGYFDAHIGLTLNELRKNTDISIASLLGRYPTCIKNNENKKVTYDRSTYYREKTSDISVSVVNEGIPCSALARKSDIDLPFWLKPRSIEKAQEVFEQSTVYTTGHKSAHDRISEINFLHDRKEMAKSSAILDENKESKLRELESQKKRDFNKLIKEIKDKVLAKTGCDPNDWYEITDIEGSGEVLARVPKLPFLCWALSGAHNNLQLPDYQTVSKSGVKIPDDNPYHTDWVIGGGIDFDDIYDTKSLLRSASYDHMFKIQQEYCEFEIGVIHNAGNVSGKITVCENELDLKKVNPGDVIVLPTGEMKYQSLVDIATSKNSGGVILQTGGKLCHMAKIGHEKKITIMLDPNAINKYKKLEGEIINLNPEKGKVAVISTPLFSGSNMAM